MPPGTRVLREPSPSLEHLGRAARTHARFSSLQFSQMKTMLCLLAYVLSSKQLT